MIWTLVAIATIAGTGDPRIGLIEAQLANQPHRALALAESLLTEDPERARDLGLDYLRGDLLERLHRERQAEQAFVATMAGSPRLAAYGRFRLASGHDRRGHPEVAAGLLATLLANDPPTSLKTPAARLLTRSISRGGDCRLLRNAPSWSLRGEPRRLVDVASADCLRADGEPTAAMNVLLRVLEESVVDEAARLAAERLHARFTDALPTARAVLLVGRAFHHQRRFDLAVTYLRRGLDALAPVSDPARIEDARYALARSHFWRGEYLEAVASFGQVAAEASSPETAAGAFYQQGRSYELHGSWDAAANSFRQAYMEDTAGRWAGASLLSTLRLEWRSGRESEALALLDVLGSRPSWAELYGRAALFLASSELVQDSPDQAAGFLDRARQSGSRRLETLIHYWSGRLAEQRQEHSAAVGSYLAVIVAAPYHPLAQLARDRLWRQQLRETSRQTLRRSATGSSARSLLHAWLLQAEEQGDEDQFEQALERLKRRFLPPPFLSLKFVEPTAWPLWKASLDQPEELLLALGLWREGEAAMGRYFPNTDVSLSYTASRLLVRSEAHPSALRLAESLHEGALARLPAPFVPVPLRRASYPLPYGSLIAGSAARHGVDPYLLTALLREESRFDPEAVSVAAARGLGQLVWPTAQRLAASVGISDLKPADLHDPATSIELAAAYLEQLQRRYDGRTFQVIAAYNAGESQAELWQAYCSGTDPAEYFTKVGFPETRGYLEKVLASRAQYAELYPPGTFDPQ